MNTVLTLLKHSLNRFSPLLAFCGLLAGLTPRAAAMIQINSVGESIIGVHFDQPLVGGSAMNVSNYTVFGAGTGPIPVTNAVPLSDGQTVALHLAANAGEFFAVGITNVAEENGTGGVTNVNAAVTGFISNLTGTNVGTMGDPNPLGQILSGLPDTFFVVSSGSGIGGTNDHCEFVYEQVTNDFDMAVLVTNLQVTAMGSEACLMARNDLTPGSASVEICIVPGTNELIMLARTNALANAIPFAPAVPIGPLCWLRMTCTNNLYTVYFGTNGVDWNPCGAVYVPMGPPLAGMAVSSHTNGLVTAAEFTDFGLAAALPGDNVLPVLTSSVYQKTNLVVMWQRTPRDFSVQVCTNFMGGSTSGPQWQFVLLPVFDTALTGTNGAMPIPGRYMTIPTSLYSNNELFVRLVQVDRLIPDPTDVTPGILFSLNTQNLVADAGSGSSLCSTTVNSSSVVTQNSASLICPAGYTYTFTTAPSAASLDTVLQVRNLRTLASVCDVYTATNDYKAQITFTVPAGSVATNYTFVAAATTATTATTPIIVQVNISN